MKRAARFSFLILVLASATQLLFLMAINTVRAGHLLGGVLAAAGSVIAFLGLFRAVQAFNHSRQQK
ncbi:hypothetical protein [Deinococcus sp. QL22]|uniref:hypothetical protein n=1 Tax=Deinococcus sp. QL22 TaxID=2939437 RepID=UPI00201785A9|nr:hypothetical protein [Deinococcus sp. QL22]UQN08188.1 hypothetical protein M1R55_19090 [Deinococcus sp. QL22]